MHRIVLTANCDISSLSLAARNSTEKVLPLHMKLILGL